MSHSRALSACLVVPAVLASLSAFAGAVESDACSKGAVSINRDYTQDPKSYEWGFNACSATVPAKSGGLTSISLDAKEDGCNASLCESPVVTAHLREVAFSQSLEDVRQAINLRAGLEGTPRDRREAAYGQAHAIFEVARREGRSAEEAKAEALKALNLD
jgi:hypothetical protein